MSKGKGVSKADAWILLVADLLLLAAVGIIAAKGAFILLLLPFAAGVLMDWYAIRNMSQEQKDYVREFWRWRK